MTETTGAAIELSEQPQKAHVNRRQSFVTSEDEKKSDEHAAGKLPPEAPPPLAPFQLHVQSLKNLVSAGLDMKNKADYDALVHPLMDRCGGSIEKLASMLNAPMSGGLKDVEGALERREAFGANRLPEKELVRPVSHFYFIIVSWQYIYLLFQPLFIFFALLTLLEGYLLGALLECSRGRDAAYLVRCIYCLHHSRDGSGVRSHGMD